MATAKELRDKLAAKQTAIGAIFTEALTKDGDGKDVHDFNRVTCLGDDVKGSIQVAQKVGELNAELNEIAIEAETIEAAEQAADEFKAREKAVKRPPHAASDQKGGPILFKTLAQQIGEHAEFKAWQDAGSLEGFRMQFPEMMPSDFLIGGGIKSLQTKTLFETTAGYAPESIRLPGIVDAVTRPITLLDIMPLSQTGGDTVTYMEETTRTHAAAEKAEGVAYAESTFVFTEKTSAVRKITDSLPVTDEQLADVPFINSYINDRLTFGVRQRLDLQVLVGNGTPPNLDGIKNVTGIQTQAKAADPISDAFFKLMTKLRVTGRVVPTHNIIHPTNWESIRLLRTADGVYIWGNPSEAGADRLWGLPVIQSDNDSAGTGYVGSFQPQWISLVERAGVTVEVGYVGTQFTEGKRTIRAQMRAAFILFRPAAFGTVTGL